MEFEKKPVYFTVPQVWAGPNGGESARLEAASQGVSSAGSAEKIALKGRGFQSYMTSAQLTRMLPEPVLTSSMVPPPLTVPSM